MTAIAEMTEHPDGLAKGEATRLRVLEAACRLFAERGYEGTGIRNIESAAGVNRGVATYHYKSKEALWKAAVDLQFAPYIADLASKKELLKDLSPDARQRHLIKNLIRMSVERPYLNQLMIQESLAKTWRIEWLIDHYLRPVRVMRAEILEDDPVASEMDRDASLHYALLGACALVFSLKAEAEALYGVNPFDESFVEQHIEHVTALFAPHARQHGTEEGDTQ